MTKKQRMIVQSLRLDLKDHYISNRNSGLICKISCLLVFSLTTIINGLIIYHCGINLSFFSLCSIGINIVMGVFLFGSNHEYWIMKKPPYDKMDKETAKWDYEDYVENYCRDYKKTWNNAAIVILKLYMAALILNFIGSLG